MSNYSRIFETKRLLFGRGCDDKCEILLLHARSTSTIYRLHQFCDSANVNCFSQFSMRFEAKRAGLLNKVYFEKIIFFLFKRIIITSENCGKLLHSA